MRGIVPISAARVLPFAAALCAFLAQPLAAQTRAAVPPLREVRHVVDGDTILVVTALPDTQSPRPLVVVLPDRFGMQPAVGRIVQVFASQGFRACAIPLRSAPTRPVAGLPECAPDRRDIRRISSVVADMLGDPGCNGMAALCAFDAGAGLGALAAASLPLFRSCAFFYPAPDSMTTRVIPALRMPVVLTVCEGDAGMAEVDRIRESAPERDSKLRITVLRNTRPFFFNSAHPAYDKKTMNRAWIETIAFFHGTLK